MVSVYKQPSSYPVLEAIAYPSNMIYEGVIIVATKSKNIFTYIHHSLHYF